MGEVMSRALEADIWLALLEIHRTAIFYSISDTAWLIIERSWQLTLCPPDYPNYYKVQPPQPS